MNRLEAYKEEIGLQFAFPFIAGLFDIGDELPEKNPGSFFDITKAATVFGRSRGRQSPHVMRQEAELYFADEFLPVRQGRGIRFEGRKISERFDRR